MLQTRKEADCRAGTSASPGPQLGNLAIGSGPSSSRKEADTIDPELLFAYCNTGK